MDTALLRSSFEAGLAYEDYLATDPGRAEAWRRTASHLRLSEGQRRLLGSFTRRMRVLAVSGIWCGDCSAQGPMLDLIARAGPQSIDLRWVDRDEHEALGRLLSICGGRRIPVVVWMAEDFEFVSLLGDRTLTRYRALAARSLGPSCPVPGSPIPQDELDETQREWIDEFERVHLLLRLSPRLRELHGD